MVKSGKRLDFWFWVKVAVVAFMLLFLIYPFCTLITRSFFSSKTEGFTLENYIRFFTKKYYYSALGRSIFVSVTTTLTTLIVGVPMAYAMSRYNVLGKKFIHIFIIMSLMSPPFIGAYSWIMLFGRSGLVTKFFEGFGIILPSIYGKLGIILVFTFKLFPYVYLYTSGAMGSIDSSLEEAAENLGSNKLRRLRTITLPVIMPSIAAGAIMVFMTSLADFGTPMLIGEGYMVLPVLVYNEYMSEIGGNAHLASALSVVVVCCSTAVLLVQKYFVSKKNYVMTAMRPPKEEEVHGIQPGQLHNDFLPALDQYTQYVCILNNGYYFHHYPGNAHLLYCGAAEGACGPDYGSSDYVPLCYSRGGSGHQPDCRF